MYLVTTPVVLMLAALIMFFLWFIDWMFKTNIGVTSVQGAVTFYVCFLIASCIGLALMFWLLAWYFVRDSQRWVAERERTRHWKDEWIEPVSRRRSSQRPVSSRPYR